MQRVHRHLTGVAKSDVARAVDKKGNSRRNRTPSRRVARVRRQVPHLRGVRRRAVAGAAVSSQLKREISGAP